MSTKSTMPKVLAKQKKEMRSVKKLSISQNYSKTIDDINHPSNVKVFTKSDSTHHTSPIKINGNHSDDEVFDVTENLERSLSLPQKIAIPERGVNTSDDDMVVADDTAKLKVENMLAKAGQISNERVHLQAALAKEAGKIAKQAQKGIN